jgi:hypothetical protein
MSHGNHDPFRMGFLTAVEDAERGFVGGLLITNRFGRPLEFQCTAPVKPNRAQQILYGPTLRPFVLGELLGRTLIDKIGVKPHLVLLETDEIIDLRQHVSIPVAFFVNKITDESTQLPLGKLGIARWSVMPRRSRWMPTCVNRSRESAKHSPKRSDLARREPLDWKDGSNERRFDADAR